MSKQASNGYPTVVRALRKAGFRLARNRRHAIWQHEDGRRLVMPMSPSDSRRGERNAIADARRIGVEV